MKDILLKAVAGAALFASSFATVAHAQQTYRTLDGTSGCVIDIGRTAAPNSAYAYTYTLRNQCSDRAFRVYYEVNGQSFNSRISRGSEWTYPVLRGETFELTAVADD